MDLREVTINDGVHIQRSGLLPPWSRINETLAEHFEMNQELYVRLGFPLSRAHAEPITSNAVYVTEYVLKSVQQRRLI